MLYTFGHSTMTWENFLQLTSKLDVLIDVRSHAGSRWPQYRQEFMKQELGDRYQWWINLGGWTAKHLPLQSQFPMIDMETYAKQKFPKQRIALKVQESDTPTWTNQGLYDYAWYMMLPEFQESANKLIEFSKEKNVGIFCCEALWWRCHRSLISDYTWFHNTDSVHLNGRATKTKGYRISETLHSTAIGDRMQRYPSAVRDAWNIGVVA